MRRLSALSIRPGILRSLGFPVLVCFLAAVVAGCRPGAGERSDTASPRKEFPVRGVVAALGDDPSEIRIRHEEIPGYMKAMTMIFAVRPTNAVAGLKPNDLVEFVLVDTGDDGWIESLKKIGEAPAQPEEAAVRTGPAVELLRVGSPVPDHVFTNQLGRVESLAALRGQAVAFTFIFTTCPRMTDNFAAVQKLLLEDAAGPKNWKLWSVTIDPETDTPSVLRAYGDRHRSDPGHWSLLTGSLSDIARLGDSVGLSFWRADGTINHNLRTVVVDPSGRVQAIFPENKWTPEELAAELRRAAAVPAR
jgi:protein SCO1/2